MRRPYLSFPPGPMTYVVAVALVLVFTPLGWWRTKRHAWRLRHER